MRKFLLGVLAVFAATLFLHAQGPTCEPCHHTYSPDNVYAHIICKTVPLTDINCAPDILGQELPVIFVLVNYRVVYCTGSNPQLIVNGVVLIDERDRYKDDLCPPSQILDQCPTIPNPLSAMDIRNYLQDGVDAAVASLGLSSDVDVIYTGSCNSLVKVAFPQRVYMLQGRGDAPGVDTVWVDTESTVWQPLPCNDACCKVKYKFEIVSGQNGETLMTWRADSWEGVDQSCPNAPLPDYETSIKRLFGLSDGTPPDTIYAVVQEQTSCSLFCDGMGTPPPPPDIDPGAPGFSTDVAEVKDPLPLKLNANPTLCSSFIRFTTNKPVSKVVVYDMAGKRVINNAALVNNELNTSELKQGVYYVQVYFSEQEVKTIKIMKQ